MRPRNHIAIVLDCSGSMYGIRRSTIEAFNGIVEEIRRRSEQEGQDTTVTLVLVANTARVKFFNADVRTLRPLSEWDYNPAGATALFDGVGLAIHSLQPEAVSPGTSFLVLVVTDGEENNSQSYTAADIKAALDRLQKTDQWTFAFQLPPGTSAAFMKAFGISRDNVREWEPTSSGISQVHRDTCAGLGNYFAARSQGCRSVSSFYVTTDLANLSTSTLAQELEDVSARFRLFTVEKEMAVRDFVESKTGRPYVIGSAYYQLMKNEKVQPTKAVLLMEKGKKVVWGGDEARRLIGLPAGVEARVVPGNHANFDIFVQSTSVNRKLPRGTRLLLDITCVKDLPPTWDHQASTRVV